MRARTTWAVGVLVAALMLTLHGPALEAVEWLPATVTLSDGATLEGKVHIPTDTFILHNEAQRRRYTVKVTEIRLLESTIEKQSMEDKWIFRESGLDDKVFTGEQIPVRHYVTRVTFHDGRRLSGHMVAKTIYVDAGGEKQRFILRRKQEGKVGQKLSDLLYVKRVAFGEPGAGARGTIQGTLEIPWGEKLHMVLAINRDKLFSIEAVGNPLSGKFRAGDCTEGTYDLVVVTDKAIYTYFSREQDKGAGRLNAEQVAQMQAWVDKLRDFFHSQTILYAAGNAKRAFALVWKERRGGTTLKGAERLHRYDVWAMHKPEDEWQIEKRFFVWRDISQDIDLKQRKVYVTPALGGHRIVAGAADLELEIKLVPNKDKPIPPAPENKGKADGD